MLASTPDTFTACMWKPHAHCRAIALLTLRWQVFGLVLSADVTEAAIGTGGGGDDDASHGSAVTPIPSHAGLDLPAPASDEPVTEVCNHVERC
jgi:hypothetical protein